MCNNFKKCLKKIILLNHPYGLLIIAGGFTQWLEEAEEVL